MILSGVATTWKPCVLFVNEAWCLNKSCDGGGGEVGEADRQSAVVRREGGGGGAEEGGVLRHRALAGELQQRHQAEADNKGSEHLGLEQG